MRESRLILFLHIALFVLVLIRMLSTIAVLPSSPGVVPAMLAVLSGRFIRPIQSMLLAVALFFAFPFAFTLPFSLALMIISRLMLLALLFPLHRRSGGR